MKEKELEFKLNLQNFAEDGEEENPNPQEEGGLADVIKKQQEKLKNSVSKDDYDKLMQENNTLKDVIINGGSIPGEEDEEEETFDIDELAKHIFNTENQCDNLEYVENALKYRKAVLKEHGYDVFAPRIGTMNANQITDDDFKAAEKVADVLQQCVDESDGDSTVFTAKLQSRILDDSLKIKRR